MGKELECGFSFVTRCMSTGRTSPSCEHPIIFVHALQGPDSPCARGRCRFRNRGPFHILRDGRHFGAIFKVGSILVHSILLSG